MPNHLIHENSPYLLQHAENLVEWYPWSPEALQRSQAEDMPIFLSIGYAACHWCHVMAHESFEDPETAAIMNEHFVNIKVDREERPDLDGIYMQAVVAITGQGGWPMSVFLTPEGKPFYGGTYFPSVARYNLPSFKEILLTIARLWKEDRPRLLQSSNNLSEHISQKPILANHNAPLNSSILNQAVQKLVETYDWETGGWGSAPKFPQPMAIEFLLRQATRGNQSVLGLIDHLLESMARGGMYDVVGGGFARYATDQHWLIPHFEKMLCDNAQLALVYLHAWLVTRKAYFKRVCEETLDFLSREMTHPLGGFYSSLDADSEGEEGKYYTWSLEEIQAALKDTQAVEFFTSAYQITESGNFEGRIVLQRAVTDQQLAEKYQLTSEEVVLRLQELHKKLLAKRAMRIRPATDDKILVAWNALAMQAFAEAGRYLERPDYLAIAQKNAHFLLDNLIKDGRLMRSWRAGQPKHNAYLEDYAALTLGLLSIYQSDANVLWYQVALSLTNDLLQYFQDPDGGFFDTHKDHEPLLYRPQELQDNATPSGNSLAACALLQIATYEGRSDFRNLAEDMLRAIQEPMVRYPTAFAQWLQAADFAIGPINEVAIIGDPMHPLTQKFLQILRTSYRPRLVIAREAGLSQSGSPALMHDRGMLDQLPTVYVCQGFVCLQPTNSPNEMAAQLDQSG